MRDAEIRSALQDWIVGQRHLSTTGITHEFKIPRPSARADIAVINGELVGYEIKSDHDTLYRLPRQIRSFNVIFDRIHLVTTDRHLEPASAIIPLWWGILRLDPGKTTPKTIRRAKINPLRKIENLVHTLSNGELLQLLHSMNVAVKGSSKRIDLISKTIGIQRDRIIRENCREILRKRRDVRIIHQDPKEHHRSANLDCVEFADRYAD